MLLLLLIGVVAWMFRSRAEAIPEELAPIDVAEADPMAVEIPGSAGLPPLKLGDYRGKTVYLVVGDRESMEAKEGQAFERALARWDYPEDVVGFGIANAEGFKLLAGTIEKFLGHMRPELRLPLYIDFEGVIAKTFKLPKGHFGVVVLGPDGTVTWRHSGPPKPDGDTIEQLRIAVRATEPERLAAPEFSAGDLDFAKCSGHTCILVFLGAPVAKSAVPGVEGGFDGDMEAMWAQLQDPNIRLASLVHDSDTKLAADKDAASRVRAVVVGELVDVPLKHWQQVAEASQARTAFAVEPNQAGVVVVDAEGKVAVRELGLVRMYKFGPISELLGVDLGERRD